LPFCLLYRTTPTAEEEEEMGDSESILTTFLGALQASLTVLLTISYGVLAARFNLLKESSAKDISNVCVKLFLPALLITNVGQELQPATAYRYVPVLRKSHNRCGDGLS
jgi:hypothetical protein